MSTSILRGAGSFAVVLALLLLPSSAPLLAEESSSVQNELNWNSVTGVTDEDLLMGGSPDCDQKCDNILNAYQTETDQEKKALIKNSQVYMQCMSYTQTENALISDIVMSAVDASAAAACTTACALVVSGNPFAPQAIATCDALGIVSGVGDLTAMITLKLINNEQFSTADQAAIAMGAAGIVMGAF